jgi:hypothetical protein
VSGRHSLSYGGGTRRRRGRDARVRFGGQRCRLAAGFRFDRIGPRDDGCRRGRSLLGVAAGLPFSGARLLPWLAVGDNLARIQGRGW